MAQCGTERPPEGGVRLNAWFSRSGAREKQAREPLSSAFLPSEARGAWPASAARAEAEAERNIPMGPVLVIDFVVIDFKKELSPFTIHSSRHV
jgi:hypothetical protein